MTWTHFKHILLGVLLVVSFFLSFGLWSVGGQRGEQSPQPTSLQTTVSLVERTSTEVFSPYQFVIHEQGNIRMARADNLQGFIAENLETLLLQQVNSSRTVRRPSYQEMLMDGEWVEFVYDDVLPLGLLEGQFSEMSASEGNQTFNRVAIDLEQPQALYVYDSTRELLLTISAEELPIESLREWTNEDFLYTEEGQVVELNEQMVYLPSGPMEIAIQNYVVEQLSEQLYLNEFFADMNQVDPIPTGNMVRYIDLTTEVQYNQVNQTLTYARERSDLEEWSLSERFHASFEQLALVENWMETVRYQSYNPDTQTLQFRRQLNGLPVFHSYEEATVEVSIVEGGLRYLKVPLRVVQTPLSLPQEEHKTMKSGEELIALIHSTPNIELAEIEDIRLGYSWEEATFEENSISGEIVQFVPEWYMKYNGQWHRIERYIELQEGQFDGL